MLRRIVCPIDFSPAARNAVQYAAKLAQLSGAGLELVYFQYHSSRALMAVAGRKKADAEAHVMKVARELENLAAELNKMFSISCGTGVETGEETLTEAIAGKAGPGDLIVAGTNGADDLFQDFFGSNAYNLAVHAGCPVLVVPEQVEYRTLTEIVFAWDYDPESRPLFVRLKELAGMLGAQITFLHVSRHISDVSKDIFNALKEKVGEVFSEGEAKFERIIAPHPQDSIDEYMRGKESAVLALAVQKGKMLREILREKHGSEEELTAAYPVLVMHA
ncbi:MAG TPA: universal stress protein [Bacteroidia bacterium]|nr:universal stress protein [Bacteroidia bacterium]